MTSDLYHYRIRYDLHKTPGMGANMSGTIIPEHTLQLLDKMRDFYPEVDRWANELDVRGTFRRYKTKLTFNGDEIDYETCALALVEELKEFLANHQRAKLYAPVHAYAVIIDPETDQLAVSIGFYYV